MLGLGLHLTRNSAPHLPSPPPGRGYAFLPAGGENRVVTARIAGRTRFVLAELPQ